MGRTVTSTMDRHWERQAHRTPILNLRRMAYPSSGTTVRRHKIRRSQRQKPVTGSQTAAAAALLPTFGAAAAALLPTFGAAAAAANFALKFSITAT